MSKGAALSFLSGTFFCPPKHWPGRAKWDFAALVRVTSKVIGHNFNGILHIIYSVIFSMLFVIRFSSFQYWTENRYSAQVILCLMELAPYFN